MSFADPTRRLILAAFAAIGATGFVVTAAAARDGYPRWAGNGPVIRGYDATAYHAARQARPGTGAHTVTWAGGTFRFASPEAAARFRANPAALAPRFGGYCTGGLSQDHVVHANPKLFRIYNGNLYLFASEAGPRRFDRDPEGVIAAARTYAKKVGVVE